MIFRHKKMCGAPDAALGCDVAMEKAANALEQVGFLVKDCRRH